MLNNTSMEYIILIVTLVGIVFGADLLVAGAVSVARRYKVSDFVIGAAIVGIGTSVPELVVSFFGALKGNADVAIGNVVGSNIFNVLGILGMTAICFPIAIDKKNMTFEIPFCIGISILLTLLALNFFDGTPAVISRVDGIILLLLFAGYMWYSFTRDKKTGLTEASEEMPTEKPTPLWLAIVKVVVGLGVLIVSCDMFVDDAVSIAKSWGVSDAIISLTLIACGTSLPELAASVVAAFKKNTQLALGNIVGSNIFNILLILGLSSQVMPLTSAGITVVDYGVMIGAAIVPLLFGFNKKIGRVGGVLMVIAFAVYTWYLIAG
ncbi:MAG: calcium/sodium antiporter [Paludibacteraceae bacterium]|nr:calcium/sodium antiporter [Paludibacteraceae bacterium]MBP3576342.1 calcium/sodium antiporter [Paludibacteraceae bacterium]